MQFLDRLQRIGSGVLHRVVTFCQTNILAQHCPVKCKFRQFKISNRLQTFALCFKIRIIMSPPHFMDLKIIIIFMAQNFVIVGRHRHRRIFKWKSYKFPVIFFILSTFSQQPPWEYLRHPVRLLLRHTGHLFLCQTVQFDPHMTSIQSPVKILMIFLFQLF